MAKKTAPLRILFLGEPDSPNTKSWVEGLKNEGCEVFLASARTEGNNECFPIGNKLLPPRLRILTGLGSVRKLIKKINPDILLAYRITSYGYLAARTGFRPLVLAAQNEQIVYLPNPTFFRKKFLAYCAKHAISKADLIHSWGANITSGLKRFGAEDKQILTLHRGIDATRFAPSESIKKFSSASPVFISTRTLAPEYLIDRLILAFKQVVEKIPNAKLEIAGSGSEEESLKELAQKLGINENTIFHGRMGNSELLKLMHSSDFYISVIETEGISSSLIESAMCGLIPIATDMPASKSIIENNKNGLLIPSPEVDNIANAMLSAVGNFSNLKQNAIANAAKIKMQYDRTKNQKLFIAEYFQLLKNENS